MGLDEYMAKKNEPSLFRKMETFHDTVNSLAKRFFEYNFRRTPNIDHTEALEKMALCASLFGLKSTTDHVDHLAQLSLNLKDNVDRINVLEKMGEAYLNPQELESIPTETLMNLALEYDKKGIIPSSEETLEDFVYRGNTILTLHTNWKKKNLKPKLNFKDNELLIEQTSQYEWAKDEDIKEAVEKIPYYMDLSWVAVSVNQSFPFPALGLTYTVPHYNGINWVEMLDTYKSREKYVDVLAHELVHAGTVHLDTKKDYLETKAYHVGAGSKILGEQVVALNSKPNLVMLMLRGFIQSYFPFLSDRQFNYLYKIGEAFKIKQKTGSFNQVKNDLEKLYGHKGNYILGRLTADELEEFRDTNSIAGRMELKEGLKWDIMKHNFSEL